MNYYYYYVFSYSCNGKRYATAERIHESTNLFCQISGNYTTDGTNKYMLDCVQQCKTMKTAQATCDAWNTAYKNNGTYAFG